MRSVWSVVVACVAVQAGCVDPSGPSEESPGRIVGRSFSTCHQAPGDVDVPDDLSQRGIRALVPDGSAAGFRVVSGRGCADGTFVIDGVPDGVTYTLQIDAAGDAELGDRFQFYVTDQRILELRGELPRRCSPLHITGSAAAIVNLQVTRMPTPFQTDTDSMELDSFGLGFGITLPARAIWGDRVDGSVEWPMGAPLVDAAAGDDLHILHLRSDQSSDATTGRLGTITRLVDWFAATGKSLQVGPATVITGQFASEAQSRSGALSIDHGRFNAGYDLGSTPREIRVRLAAHPWSSFAPRFGGSATLAEVTLTEYRFNDTSGELEPIFDGTTTTNFTYVDPFPASWKRSLSIDSERFHFVRLSSTVRGISTVGGYQQRIEDPTAIEAYPQLSPPTGITVAGVDFAVGGKLAFDGRSPVVVRWNAVPSAQIYCLVVIHSTGDPTVYNDVVRDSVITADTSLTLPAEMFTSGTAYQFTLAAIQTPADFRSGQLMPRLVPRVTAAVPSGRFRFTASCGDGIVQPEEDCDTAGESATCNIDCTAPLCGDGLRNATAGEACDNTIDCNEDCTLRGAPRGFGRLRW